MTPTVHTFDGLGIAPRLLEALDKLQFATPTPIQYQSIPHALAGKDIMGIAQTGTGKTLAFGIPVLQRLAQAKGIALILLPTRELAVQVNEDLHNIGRFFHLRTAVLIGGESIGRQIRTLRQNPHVIIATPGRLMDHLAQKTISLSAVKTLILDEADRMLDMGFAPQIKRILQHVPKERQTMLFSATMPPEIVSLATSYMRLPVRVEVAPSGTAAPNVTHEIFFVHQPAKMPLLKTLLAEYTGSMLVFSRTKHGAKKIAADIRAAGIRAAEIHSNRTLNQRLAALNGFKTGVFRVLVATDIAARGIDVKNIELVVNYDLPEKAEDYVHRIGRTGRAGHTGHAISFATPAQRRDVFAIERLIKKPLPVSKLPAGIAAGAPRSNFVQDLPIRQAGRPRQWAGKPQRNFNSSAPRRPFRPASPASSAGRPAGRSGGNHPFRSSSRTSGPRRNNRSSSFGNYRKCNNYATH